MKGLSLVAGSGGQRNFDFGTVVVRALNARRVRAVLVCLALFLSVACGANEPPNDGGLSPEATRAGSDLGMANAWVHLSNEGPGGLLSGTASFALDDVGQFDAWVSVYGQGWVNERVDGRVHHLGGPGGTADHSAVGAVSVAVAIGGGYNLKLTCGKVAENEGSSLFACLVGDGNLATVLGSEGAEPGVGDDSVQGFGAFCDAAFRNQLVFQRTSSTSERMNAVVVQIQAQWDECTLSGWGPVVVDPGVGFAAGILTDVGGDEIIRPEMSGCVVRPDGGLYEAVGGIDIPTGLKVGQGGVLSHGVLSSSGRDSGNNIIVHFAAYGRPADGSRCWMYVDRLREWGHEYY